MESKLISDIRYFESIDFNKPNPSYIGTLYKLDRSVNLIGGRYASKLRQLGFRTGGVYDHIYIIFTPVLPHGTVSVADLPKEKWFTWLNVGVELGHFDGITAENVHDDVVKLTTLALNFLKTDLQTLAAVETQMLKERTELEIVHKVKETSHYRMSVTYQIKPLGQASKAFIEFFDKGTQKLGKIMFQELRFAEDIYSLVSVITMKNGIITLKPRNSFRANMHTSGYETPIEINVQDIMNDRNII